MCLHSSWESLFKSNTQERQISKAQHRVPKAGEYKQSIFLTKCKFHDNDMVPIRTQLLPFSGPAMVTTVHWYPLILGPQSIRMVRGPAPLETHNSF